MSEPTSGSVNTAVGSTVAGGDLRQPEALLLLGAAARDQLGGDLGAGAERADADIAARQFLGDDAHRLLAEPHAAVVLRDREAEHAEVRHLRDDVERDRCVGEMPAMRLRHHLAVGEFAHLLAHRHQRFVDVRTADGEIVEVAQQRHQPRAALLVAGAIRLSSGPAMRAATAAALRPRSAGRTNSPWLIGMPPSDLRQEFADARSRPAAPSISLSAPASMSALGKGVDLADALDIGREPGEPMGGALLAVEQPVDGVGLDPDPRAHGGGRVLAGSLPRPASPRAQGPGV